ncbi:hypothetical protein X737_25900 [Mesorhizobium sp. L48C026A00]|nr:hypothetical protein X737_25900 [Mesorhizobium sp. L48C026A00]
MAARKVRWRGSTSLTLCLRLCRPLTSRRESAAGSSTRMCEAASSIAKGKPSRRRQI